MILSLNAHRNLGWRPAQAYGFARNLSLVPITADELPRLAKDMTVAFRKQGNQWQAVTLLGPMPGLNLQVQADGCWSGRFVPGVLLSYPFQLSPDCTTLAFWPDYTPEIAGIKGVEPLFVDGQLTPVLVAALAFLQDQQQAMDRLGLVLSWLAERDLLRPWQVPYVVETAHFARHTGLFAVDRNRLEALDEADWFALHRIMPVSTVLTVVNAHLSSLDHARVFNLHSSDMGLASVRHINPDMRPRDGEL